MIFISCPFYSVMTCCRSTVVGTFSATVYGLFIVTCFVNVLCSVRSRTLMFSISESIVHATGSIPCLYFRLCGICFMESSRLRCLFCLSVRVFNLILFALIFKTHHNSAMSYLYYTYRLGSCSKDSAIYHLIAYDFLNSLFSLL